MNKPVAIAHSNKISGNANLASCCYIARKKGIYNGMFVPQALNLCNDLVILPYQFEDYQEVSIQVYKILLTKVFLEFEEQTGFTFEVEEVISRLEAVSVDEANLDISHLLFANLLFSDTDLLATDLPDSKLERILEERSDHSGQAILSDIVSKIREAIFISTGCTASAGVGCNKLIAKVGCKKAKPNGQLVLNLDSSKHIHEMIQFMENVKVEVYLLLFI